MQMSEQETRRKRTREEAEAASDSNDDDDEVDGIISPVDSCALVSIVIFGADGDLSRNKILPTLFNAWRRQLLPHDLLVFGFAHPPNAEPPGKFSDTSEFREHLRSCLQSPLMVARNPSLAAATPASPSARPPLSEANFVERCHFLAGAFRDEAAYAPLIELVAAEEERRLSRRRSSPDSALALPGDASQVRMYYLATPPFLYPTICATLRGMDCRLQPAVPAASDAAGAAVLTVRTEERFVLEKPFGRDTASCEEMVRQLSMLRAEEVFYMDHYLGKELVMNLLVLRFANVCFEGIWSRQHIKCVQVIFKEAHGTAGRGGYFDRYGIIRDVLQNHLLQMLALVAMEQPLSFDAEDIRAEKLKVLRAVKPLKLCDLVTGQYEASGEQRGYLEDATVTDKTSATETFAAAVLHVHRPAAATRTHRDSMPQRGGTHMPQSGPNARLLRTVRGGRACPSCSKRARRSTRARSSCACSSTRCPASSLRSPTARGTSWSCESSPRPKSIGRCRTGCPA